MGSLFDPHVGQKLEDVLVAGQMTAHLQSAAELPLSKVPNPQNVRGSCHERHTLSLAHDPTREIAAK